MKQSKILFVFYGPLNLITVFTKPTTCPYAEPDESSPRHLHPIYLKYILVLLSNLRLGQPSGLFPRSPPPPKPCMRICSPSYVAHAPYVSSLFIVPPNNA